MPRRRSWRSTCSCMAPAMRSDLARPRRGAASRPSLVWRDSRTASLVCNAVHSAAPISCSAISRRLILPFSDFGSASRNSTAFGTMKSSRCLRAVADHVVARERGAALERHDRLDRHAEHRIGHADDRRLADAGQRVEDVLDLLRAHFLAARLDDVVLAADEIEEAVGVGAEEVAGVEHLLPRVAGRAAAPARSPPRPANSPS